MIYNCSLELTFHGDENMNKTANQTWCWISESCCNRNTHSVSQWASSKQARQHHFRISVLNCNITWEL